MHQHVTLFSRHSTSDQAAGVRHPISSAGFTALRRGCSFAAVRLKMSLRRQAPRTHSVRSTSSGRELSSAASRSAATSNRRDGRPRQPHCVRRMPGVIAKACDGGSQRLRRRGGREGSTASARASAARDDRRRAGVDVLANALRIWLALTRIDPLQSLQPVACRRRPARGHFERQRCCGPRVAAHGCADAFAQRQRHMQRADRGARRDALGQAAGNDARSDERPVAVCRSGSRRPDPHDEQTELAAAYEILPPRLAMVWPRDCDDWLHVDG